jgi:hypothetical protein
MCLLVHLLFLMHSKMQGLFGYQVFVEQFVVLVHQPLEALVDLEVQERLLLENLREQGTVAQPLMVLQQEELVAAERMWLQ